jgi:hypothetical protein
MRKKNPGYAIKALPEARMLPVLLLRLSFYAQRDQKYPSASSPKDLQGRSKKRPFAPKCFAAFFTHRGAKAENALGNPSERASTVGRIPTQLPV